MDGTEENARAGWLRRSFAGLSPRPAPRVAPACRTPALRGTDSPLQRARIAAERRRLAAELDALERRTTDGDGIGELRRSLAALRTELCGT
jgi:hypothetical protein